MWLLGWKHFGDLLFVLSLSFFLSALLLIIIINVAALALSLCVDLSLARMSTVGGHASAPVLVIAVIAHPKSVKRKVSMRAGGNNPFLGS